MPIVKSMPPALILTSEAPEENVVLAWTEHDPPVPFAEVRVLDPDLHARCMDEHASKDATAKRLLRMAHGYGYGHLVVILPHQDRDRHLANLALILQGHARAAHVDVTVLRAMDLAPPLAAGQRIRTIRLLLKMKGQPFADWIGRTRQMLDRWERRKDRVDRFTLWGISGATGANFFYLLEGRGEPFGSDPRARQHGLASTDGREHAAEGAQ